MVYSSLKAKYIAVECERLTSGDAFSFEVRYTVDSAASLADWRPKHLYVYDCRIKIDQYFVYLHGLICNRNDDCPVALDGEIGPVHAQ